MPPQINSMSLHEVVQGAGQAVFLYGTGFTGVTEVSVGDTRVEVRVDGDDVITLHPPDLEPGDYWVQAHGPDGSSPLLDGQQALRITAATGDAPAQRLELTGLTPAEITLGRSDTYWLSGTGLSGVTAVFLGDHGCHFEGYDDTRLILTSPESVPEVQADVEMTISVMGTAGSAELRILCRVPAAPTPLPLDPSEHRYPMVLGIEPTTVAMTGGTVRVAGANFTMATRFFLGSTECQVSDVTETSLTATVPPAAGYDGEFLTALAMDRDVAGTNADGHGVTVTSAV